MSNVVSLPRKEPLAWMCSCGCLTFKAYADNTLECARCGSTDAASNGEWVKEPAPAQPREAPGESDTVATFQKSAAMVLRDLLPEAKEMSVILAIRESGKHTTWAEDCTTPERIAWLDRQFALARKMIVRDPS